MEDAYSVQLPLDKSDSHSAYFAVFDGHGSKHYSAYCGKELHNFVLQNEHYGELRVGLFGGGSVSLYVHFHMNTCCVESLSKETIYQRMQ